MLDTSQDLLFTVLAFCALWLTFFISWLLFYVIMMVKRAYQVTNSIKAKLELAERVLTSIREKIESSASSINLLAASVGKIIEFVADTKTTPAAKPARKTTRKKKAAPVEEEEEYEE